MRRRRTAAAAAVVTLGPLAGFLVHPAGGGGLAPELIVTVAD